MNDPAFALSSPATDTTTETILLAATNHDLTTLKPLLRIPGNASVQDLETRTTPLHAAIVACGPAKTQSQIPNRETNEAEQKENGTIVDEEEYGDSAKAAEVVRELFLSGAIWNDLDANNETPGCLAHRLGQMELYNLCVEAGVRAELLLSLMGGYEELSSGPTSEDDEPDAIETIENGVESNGHAGSHEHEVAVGPAEAELVDTSRQRDVNSRDYLSSTLTFEANKLLDADHNGVMMSWETPIMRRTVDLLLPDGEPGARILNIGFGMGIIDRIFSATSPSVHHIIEAHPAVLASLQSEGSDFGRAWEASAPEGGSYKIHAGRWQDVVPTLLEAGRVYDAIYFDTFAESYAQLKYFFDEHVPGLLDACGRFGFFNGLGADRRVCYDVYCRVVECHGEEAGMEVQWTDVKVDGKGMEKENEGEWEGVRRRYWVLENYRLPIMMFLG